MPQAPQKHSFVLHLGDERIPLLEDVELSPELMRSLKMGTIKPPKLEDDYQRGVTDERERCTKIACSFVHHTKDDLAQWIADAIRTELK